MREPPTVRDWHNAPATRHSGGGSLSFAGGHVEFWKWSEPTTEKLNARDVTVRNGDRDLQRLKQAIGSELERLGTRTALSASPFGLSEIVRAGLAALRFTERKRPHLPSPFDDLKSARLIFVEFRQFGMHEGWRRLGSFLAVVESASSGGKAFREATRIA